METEKRLADYLVNTRFEDLPQEPLDAMKNVVLTVLGTTLAGATAQGCEEMARLARAWSGCFPAIRRQPARIGRTFQPRRKRSR